MSAVTTTIEQLQSFTKMNRDRSKRFLIDSIDEKLGSVEKEKKFDLIMVFIGLALIVAGILLLSFSKASGGWSVLFIFMVMIGLSLCYVMTKEYIDDSRKAKRQQLNK